MASSFSMSSMNSNGLAYHKVPDQEILKEMHSDEYGDQILTRFNEFRQEGMFSDFMLTVEDCNFKVFFICLFILLFSPFSY